MKEELKWQGLLNTLLGHKFGQDQEITNVKIEENEVIFRTSPDAFRRLQDALKNPAILKESVSHALPVQRQEEEGTASEASEPQKELLPKLPESAREVLDAVLSQKFQQFVGIDVIDFHDTRPGIASWKIGSTPNAKPLEVDMQKAELQEKLAKLNFLRNAFKDMDLLCGIILGDAGPIESTDGARNFVSNEVLQVKEAANGTEAEALFNWGRVLEEVSANPKLHGSSPAMSARTNSEGEYSVKMDALAYYIPEHLGPLLFHQTSNTYGVVYGTKGKGEAKEEESASESNTKTIFHLVIDHSISLQNKFPQYIQMIQKSVDLLVKNCLYNWEIRITGFGNKADKTVTFNSTSHKKSDVTNFIGNIKCSGMTALHDAILASLPEDKSGEEGVNIVLYTDGQENSSKVKDRGEIVNRLANVRDGNSDFSMTSIGYGDTDEKFFSEVATANGFHHTHIDKLEEVDNLQGHFLSLNGTKALYEFVHQLIQHKLKMQTIEGQVTATENVPVGATVRHGEKEFKFDTEAGAIAAEEEKAKAEAEKAALLAQEEEAILKAEEKERAAKLAEEEKAKAEAAAKQAAELEETKKLLEVTQRQLEAAKILIQQKEAEEARLKAEEEARAKAEEEAGAAAAEEDGVVAAAADNTEVDEERVESLIQTIKDFQNSTDEVPQPNFDDIDPNVLKAALTRITAEKMTEAAAAFEGTIAAEDGAIQTDTNSGENTEVEAAGQNSNLNCTIL